MLLSLNDEGVHLHALPTLLLKFQVSREGGRGGAPPRTAHPAAQVPGEDGLEGSRVEEVGGSGGGEALQGGMHPGVRLRS